MNRPDGGSGLANLVETMCFFMAMHFAFSMLTAVMLFSKLTRQAPGVARIYVCNRLPPIGMPDYAAWIKTQGGCVAIDRP